ncbi:hypothetical protein K443DRAFT_638574 [Laccaria amethystina LaAM-08-1]|uniref:SCP domain-containing protein n=1 Tax=Laccaria amethystina LaAM-08-1 TaxID=1095629 RepID=A0A0C9X113_9AGAR|nr:hypothetical protein K443DRAFT_638574 [Laccaria amethystina LaAM-08-1]
MKLSSLIVIPLSLALSSSASHGFLKKRLNAVTNDKIDNPGSSSTPETTTPYAGPTPAAVYQSGTDGFSADVLTQHNDARAKYRADPVTWSAALFPDTQAYANKSKMGAYANISCSTGSDYSENLYVGGPRTTKPYPIMDAVNSWMGEASDFDYNNPKSTDDNGHFINLVFQSETQVACAVGVCAAGTIQPDAESQFVVCRYSGNNDKGFAYVVDTDLKILCF